MRKFLFFRFKTIKPKYRLILFFAGLLFGFTTAFADSGTTGGTGGTGGTTAATAKTSSNATGNVTSSATGDVTSHTTGNTAGGVSSNAAEVGNVTNNTTSDVSGNTTEAGNVTNNTTSDVSGNATEAGKVSGSATGNSKAESNANIKVQQSNTKAKVVIFPNPTSGLVTVRVECEAKNISIQLFCQNGRCVLNKKLHAPADNLLYVGDLEAGVYMYNILENYKKTDAGKLIISK